MKKQQSEDHDWCWDQLVPYIAGALDVDECARVERHVADCPNCMREFKDLSTLTASMWDLFTDARPPEDLEERVIGKLRAGREAAPLPAPKLARIAAGLAAAVFLGVVGFVFQELHAQ